MALILLIIQQGNRKAKASETYIDIHTYTRLVAVGGGGEGQFMNFWGGVTRDSYSTNKSEPNGAFILPTHPVPPLSLHQCSVLKVYKAS